MSKKKSKGEEEAGQAPAEESQVRPDEVADVKLKKKGKADEGAVSVDGAKNAAPHPEEAAKPKLKMDLKDYERELARLEIELVKLQEWIKFKGLKVVVVFEGRERGRQGRHHQDDHRMPQPTHLPRGGVGRAHRAGEVAVVFPALRRASAGGG